MPAQYPIPSSISPCSGGTRVGFSEVTGLTQENQAIEYRTAPFPSIRRSRCRGEKAQQRRPEARQIVKSDNDFFKWLSTVASNTVERRDLVISLLNENHEPVMTRKAHNAFLPSRSRGRNEGPGKRSGDRDHRTRPRRPRTAERMSRPSAPEGKGRGGELAHGQLLSAGRLPFQG